MTYPPEGEVFVMQPSERGDSLAVTTVIQRDPEITRSHGGGVRGERCPQASDFRYHRWKMVLVSLKGCMTPTYIFASLRLQVC